MINLKKEVTIKKILNLFLVILLISPLVSAFDIEDLFYGEWGDWIILGLVFIVLFAFIHFALSKKYFKDNVGVAAVISLASSAIISYALFATGRLEQLIEIISLSGQTITIIGVIIIGIVILWSFLKFTKKSFKP